MIRNIDLIKEIALSPEIEDQVISVRKECDLAMTIEVLTIRFNDGEISLAHGDGYKAVIGESVEILTTGQANVRYDSVCGIIKDLRGIGG